MPQLGLCHECGDEVPRRDLVRMLRPYGYIAGINLLPYSSYNASYWACDATDASASSLGLYLEKSRPRVSLDGTVAISTGAQTWTGSGTYRTSSSVDASGYTNLNFSCHVGAFHQQTNQVFTVDFGLCDASGGNKSSFGTWTIRGQQLIWGYTAVSGISSPLSASTAYVYVTPTLTAGTDKWWVDMACVCDSSVKPFIRPYTSGAAVSRTSSGFTYKTPQLCPKCAQERLLKPSEDEGEPNPREFEWVDIKDRIQSL